MYVSAPTNRYYEPSITIGKGRAHILLAVRPDFFHSGHAIHGSVYFKLLDDAAYFAASSTITDAHLVTVSFNLYFIRPVDSGVLSSEGTLINRSSRLVIAEARVCTETGKLVAQGSGTFMKSDLPLDERVGYC